MGSTINSFKLSSTETWGITGFAYKCDTCGWYLCLRCLSPDTVTCQGHEHPLSYYVESEEQCSCGKKNYGYKCKECNFAVDYKSIALPRKFQHKCDQHLLTLTYGDDNTYSACHFCEEIEIQSFAHPNCVLGRGRYPFMKLGEKIEFEDHPHPLTFVKKMYYYPKCSASEEPCLDLALECQEPMCQCLVHWNCFGSSFNLLE
ncbi:hypothetical protein PTKIN_Ptkin02bG0048600 [Pterospermum kingtungense]